MKGIIHLIYAKFMYSQTDNLLDVVSLILWGWDIVIYKTVVLFGLGWDVRF